jgi:hypothetical protein
VTVTIAIHPVDVNDVLEQHRKVVSEVTPAWAVSEMALAMLAASEPDTHTYTPTHTYTAMLLANAATANNLRGAGLTVENKTNETKTQSRSSKNLKGATPAGGDNDNKSSNTASSQSSNSGMSGVLGSGGLNDETLAEKMQLPREIDGIDCPAIIVSTNQSLERLLGFQRSELRDRIGALIGLVGWKT